MTDEVQRSLGRIEGSIEALREEIRERSARVDSIEVRVRSVEATQANSAGRHSMIGSATGFLGGIIAAYFGKHF